MVTFWHCIRNTILCLAVVAFILSLSCNLILSYFNLYLNVSPSLPLGLYQAQYLDKNLKPGLFSFNLTEKEGSEENADDTVLRRNDLVLLCLKDEMATMADERDYIKHGKCPNATAPLGKHLTGIAGDTINFSDQGVFLNGSLIEHTRPALYDEAGRAMPYLRDFVTLQDHEYVVLNPKINSFDSRYFGIVKQEQIVAKLQPVLIFFDEHSHTSQVTP